MQWIRDIKYNNWKWMVVLFEVIGQAWQGFAAETNPGSALIPEVLIPYRYRIVLVSIARIDTVLI